MFCSDNEKLLYPALRKANAKQYLLKHILNWCCLVACNEEGFCLVKRKLSKNLWVTVVSWASCEMMTVFGIDSVKTNSMSWLGLVNGLFWPRQLQLAECFTSRCACNIIRMLLWRRRVCHAMHFAHEIFCVPFTLLLASVINGSCRWGVAGLDKVVPKVKPPPIDHSISSSLAATIALLHPLSF